MEHFARVKTGRKPPPSLLATFNLRGLTYHTRLNPLNLTPCLELVLNYYAVERGYFSTQWTGYMHEQSITFLSLYLGSRGQGSGST